MWMMTKMGFFSIVNKDGGIVIRARCKKDLENLQEWFSDTGPIFNTSHRDYPYRQLMDEHEFRKQFSVLAELVDYPNFKAEVAKTNPKREKLYHQVWALLRQIEEEN